MALTRDFKDTVRDRVKRDPEFCRALLWEVLDAIQNGEPELAKILFRDYKAATQ